MAKDRDWVDYANLTANVVQTVQLDSISSKMQQMAELELQKEYREQQEAAVAKCEDLLRDAVFFYSEQMRDLEEIANQNPVAAYIRASHLKGTYEKMPQFNASGFRKFEDKERLANVQRTCDRLIREGAARLKSDELEKCERCIDHIVGRDELVQLISVQQKREQLAKESLPARQAAKQKDLERLREKLSQKHPLWVTLGYVVGSLSLLLAALTTLYIVFMSEIVGFNNSVIIIVGLVLISACLFIALPKTNYARRKNELAKQAAALELDIAVMNNDAARRQAEINQHLSLYAKFGEAKSDDYRKLLHERDTLLTEMLGELAKGFIERRETPVATFG